MENMENIDLENTDMENTGLPYNVIVRMTYVWHCVLKVIFRG